MPAPQIDSGKRESNVFNRDYGMLSIISNVVDSYVV
jgi:hypothetical protein